MSQRILYLLLLICIVSLPSWAEKSSSAEGKRLGALDASHRLIERVLGKEARGRLQLELARESEPSAGEYFVLGRKAGKPLIRANSSSALTRGIKHYLQHYLHIEISWNSLHAKLPAGRLPLPTKEERHECSVPFRYYLNYCTYSYSMAFWDWERWEEELDFMALQGINAPLMLLGMESVWRDILLEMNYSEQEVSQFVAGPAFGAWFLMNNLEGWGGPNPEWWYTQRRELATKVADRMRELGMTPVLPGYSGMIPHDMGKRMGWEVADPGLWCAFQRPAFLLPTNKHFGEMAERYYKHLTKLLGKSKYYSMDPFHEGGNTAGVDLPKSYQAVYDAMLRESPGAQWVVQSWHENPRKECLATIPPKGLIILDLFSDATPKWQSYGEHLFSYCMLHNFGGRTGLHGRLESTAKGFREAQTQKPNTLIGIGATPEGIETNPALYDMLYSLAWDKALDKDSWLRPYLHARYGEKPSEALVQAWELIIASAYACPTKQEGTSEAVYLARPSLEVRSVSTWSTSKLYYEPEELIKALQHFLAGRPKQLNESYTYDLVDLLRQVLADHAYTLLPQIKKSYEAGDMQSYLKLADRFTDIILDTDELLGSVRAFRLGQWTEAARKLAPHQEGQDWLEWNARTLITTWGNRKAANEGRLRDYSNRAWAGLLKDYYFDRWKQFFVAIEQGDPEPDWYAFEESFTKDLSTQYSAEPEGDSMEIVLRLSKKYGFIK